MLAGLNNIYNSPSLLLIFITLVASIIVAGFIYFAFKKLDQDDLGSTEPIFIDVISSVFGESINVRDIRVNAEAFLNNTNHTLTTRDHPLVLNGRAVAIVKAVKQILDNRAVFTIEVLPSSTSKALIKKLINGIYRLTIEPTLLNNVVIGSRHFYIVERRK